MKKLKVSILTGAGISRALGYPLAEDIQFCLFEDKRLNRRPNGNFHLSGDGEHDSAPSRNKVAQVRKTLRTVRVLCDSYSRSETNYEDWFYIMDQIHRSITGDLDNLLVIPFIEKLEEILSKNIREPIDQIIQGRNLNVSTHCRDACKMISDVVREKLSISPNSNCSNKVRWLADALKDKEIGIKALMTLNQDRVLEHLLDESRILWSDGFGGQEIKIGGGLKKWNSQNFNAGKIPLLKLHGSVDWYRVEEQFNDQISHQKRCKSIHFLKGTRVENIFDDQKEEVLSLIGRHNKALSYSAPLFNELHMRAGALLEKSNALIVVGYSFMDKFINRMILNWLLSGKKRKLLVVTPSQFQLVTNAKNAIAMSMTEWEKREDLGFVEGLSEEISWKQLKEKLENIKFDA